MRTISGRSGEKKWKLFIEASNMFYHAGVFFTDIKNLLMNVLVQIDSRALHFIFFDYSPHPNRTTLRNRRRTNSLLIICAGRATTPLHYTQIAQI